MVSVNQLEVVYGDRVLFEEVGFLLSKSERMGLAGKNGAGKSTLLKIIAGIQTPDKGTISMPKDCRVAYLPQEMKHNEGETIFKEAEKGKAEVLQLQKEFREVEHAVATRTDYESEEFLKLCDRLNELSLQLSVNDAGSSDEDVARILKGLGFTEADFDKPMSTFSGGWKMRVELAKMLLRDPDLLLMDEPTNHLDIESIIWLEEFLMSHHAAVIVISHDKRFLDNVTTRTIEISKGKVYNYKASYSKYIELRKTEIEIQRNSQKNQQRHIEKTQQLIDQFRAKASKASFAQKLIKQLDKVEVIEVDEFENTSMHIKFPPAPHSGKITVEFKNVGKRYDTKEIFKNLDLVIARGEKIALVGKNGVGKTTFTKLLTGREKYDGEIILGHQVTPAYFAQDEAEKLSGDLTVEQTIDHAAVGEIRKQIRNLLGAFMFQGDDIMKKVKVLSGGEKTRLALCRLLLSPVNFIILDEPTNHLDIASKERLKEALKKYDGTLLIVSHDRDFLEGLTDRTYEIFDKRIKTHFGPISEFLKNRTIAEAEWNKQPHYNEAAKKEVTENKKNFEADKEKEKELKKAQNRLAKLEQEIAELEKQQVKMEEEIAVMNYDDKEKTEKTLEKYNQLKSQIDAKYAELEKI
jgi:ATP-binding cassette, subfamily F, member 3